MTNLSVPGTGSGFPIINPRTKIRLLFRVGQVNGVSDRRLTSGHETRPDPIRPDEVVGCGLRRAQVNKSKFALSWLLNYFGPVELNDPIQKASIRLGRLILKLGRPTSKAICYWLGERVKSLQHRRTFKPFRSDSNDMAMEIDEAVGSQLIPKDEVLFKAAESGDVSFFEKLTEDQVRKVLLLRNEDARSLLHVAASSGRVEVLEILSAADSSKSAVNGTDEEGWAPIHSAASTGNAEIVKILLSRGADANLKNDGGRTALHYAASKGWVKIAEVLISHGANINSKDKVGCTPLHRAASVGNSELCELLIEEGVEVDAEDIAGQTPLMSAVISENKEVAMQLIRHGADVDVEDKEGYTVLGRASNELRPLLIDAAMAMLE